MYSYSVANKFVFVGVGIIAHSEVRRHFKPYFVWAILLAGWFEDAAGKATQKTPLDVPA
jgi:hypothetical protein